MTRSRERNRKQGANSVLRLRTELLAFREAELRTYILYAWVRRHTHRVLFGLAYSYLQQRASVTQNLSIPRLARPGGSGHAVRPEEEGACAPTPLQLPQPEKQ